MSGRGALPEAFRFRLEREWTHLDAIEARLAAVTATRDEQIATGTDRVAAVARQLCTMRGVAETSAAVFSAELFGTRTFRNGRQIGAVLGLVRPRLRVPAGAPAHGERPPACRDDSHLRGVRRLRWDDGPSRERCQMSPVS